MFFWPLLIPFRNTNYAIVSLYKRIFLYRVNVSLLRLNSRINVRLFIGRDKKSNTKNVHTLCVAVVFVYADVSAKHMVPMSGLAVTLCVCSAISVIARLRQNRWTYPRASAMKPIELSTYRCWIKLFFSVTPIICRVLSLRTNWRNKTKLKPFWTSAHT